MSDWRPERHAALAVEPDPLASGAFRVEPQGGTVAVRGPRRRLARGRVRLLLLADLLAIAVSMAAMYLVAELIGPPAIIAPGWLMAGLLPLAVLGWIGIFAIYRLYEGETRAITTSSFDEVGPLFTALLAGSLLYLIVGQGVEKFSSWFVYSPVEAALFVAFAVVLIPALRGALRTWVMPAVMRPRRTLIVGAGSTGRLLSHKLDTHPEYGMRLVGFVDDDAEAGEGIVGCTEDLTRLVDELEIDWVVLAATGTSYEQTLDRVRAVRRPDVHLSIVPNYFELFASNATIEDLEGMPVVSLPPMAFSRSTRALKRTVDVAVSGLGLLALSPLLAATALLVKLDSRGPVLFRQPREGRGGETFEIVKFRTMVDGAEAQRDALADRNLMDGSPLFKIKDDPRITRVGRVLRASSIDELPQLLNVLRGQMSLVGPRPFVVHESEQITGWAGRRLETTPGITGLWQVLGRNDIPFEEMVKLDYIYVTNWSLWWDIKILCQTIPVVLNRKGY